MIPAFPKPGQIKKQPVAVRVFRDGRGSAATFFVRPVETSMSGVSG